MSHAKYHSLFVTGMRSLTFAICLAFCVPLIASAQSSDEAKLRRLTEDFFAAYQKEDLDGVMALWSVKSPDLAATKQTIEKTFAAVEKIEMKSLAVRKVMVDGGKATVRVVVEMSAVDAKTGKAAEGFGKMNRRFDCIKEDGAWRVWWYVPSEEDLAAALVAAKTEEERKALLAAEKELVTVELQRALITQGAGLFNRGSYQQALSVYYLVLNLAEGSADKAGIATALRQIGLVYQSQGKYSQALEYYKGGLRLREELRDTAESALVFNDIGAVHWLQGDYVQALEYHQKSLKLAEELDNKPVIARALNSIGLAHSSQGSYNQALEYYHKSLKLAEQLGNKRLISAVLNNLGIVQRSQGNYMRSLEYYQESLKLAEELGNRPLIASRLNNLGVVHDALGNYMQASEYYQKSLKLSEESGDKEGIGNSLNNIGLVHEAQGNYTQALEYYQKSLNVSEEVGRKEGIAATLNNIGSVYQSQGNYVQALEHHQKSMSLAEESGDKDLISGALYRMASTYESQSNHTKAIEMADRSAAITKQIGSPEGFWNACVIAGRAYRALNQADRAGQAFADAINTIEGLRGQVAGSENERQRFLERRVSPYYEMVDLLIDRHAHAEALVYAERAKGRVLLDVLSAGKSKVTKAMTTDEQDQERKLNAELVSLNTQMYREKLRQQPDEKHLADLNVQLQKARLEYEVFQTNLYAAHPQLKAHRGNATPLTLKESAALITDTNTALLEFVVMENKTHLFVLTKDSGQSIPDLKVHTLNIKQKDLADIVQLFRKRLANHDALFQDPATKLYQLLLAPAHEQFKNKATLMIVPDGALWELPFQALMPARNRYLIEGHAISYTPSLTVLREMVRLRQKHINSRVSPTLLAFGNPVISQTAAERIKSVFMDERLVPLPEAEKQVKAIAQFYGRESRVYVGVEAREDRVKKEAGNCRILHLASHGILNDASPMYSQIVMSQPEADANEDGLLEAWEIMNLELRADLVVLSACDTGRGGIRAGEGVIGFTWALFVAGCPTSVVSQWKVESSSTTELMVEFHRNLKPQINNPKSKITKAEALRRAALKLLKTDQYRHPFYWAPFVMIGDGR